MPWLHEFLTSISRSRARSRPRLGIRVLAATLSAVLAFGTIAPGVALAAEADSEQEGSAPPGALPGLEEAPELEPGAEETVLEELPGAPVGGEESEEGPPLETEPPQEPAPAAAPPAAAGLTAEAAQPPVEEAASAPAPGPQYGPGSPPPAPVENQPLTAPQSPPSRQPAQHAPEAVQSVPEAPSPASPPQAPEPQAGPVATPAQRDGAAGSLAGHAVHTVRAGECLWSIAEAMLPADAGSAEIAAEVRRLWKLNAARIGTGDPSLLYVGTELRLR